MTDIFVSYARADKARVAPLVTAIEALGWSVWWDPEITPGQEFDSQISAALDAAKAVIVVWTPASVDSRWVRGEAREAADRGVLVPVRFETARLPIDARAMHTTDMDDWNGDPASQAFRDLARAVTKLIAPNSGDRGADTAPAPRGVSICVLPFANMSGDAEQEYFADGISEDIITDLSKVAALAVISRNSSFTFKGKHVDLPQVARRLNVSHVLEGSVRKAGNRVRITAQLIDAATNDHVWAERYDRDLDDIFALQDEISQQIVKALKLKLFPAEKRAIEQRSTTNFEAFDLYLRAQSLARTFTPAEIFRAIEIYRQALALDPDFALAWAGLANALRRARINASGDDDERMSAEMADALAHALELAPNAWPTHLSKAGLLRTRRDYLGAEQAIASAVALAPASEPQVLTSHGMFLAQLGRTREAIGLVQSALRTEPLSLETSSSLQIVFDNAGERASAQAEYDRSKDLAGDRGLVEHYALMRLWGHEGPDRVAEQFDRFLACETLNMPVHQELRQVMDRPDLALGLLRRDYDEPAYQDPMRQSILSHWAAYYGDNDLALGAMRRSLFELNAPALLWIWHPVFSGLRADPRFKAILRDLGLIDHYRATGHWGDCVRPVGEDDFEVFR